MAKNIRITAGSVVVDAELNDTDTASAIWEVLTSQANGNTSGDKIYFRISDENGV